MRHKPIVTLALGVLGAAASPAHAIGVTFTVAHGGAQFGGGVPRRGVYDRPPARQYSSQTPPQDSTCRFSQTRGSPTRATEHAQSQLWNTLKSTRADHNGPRRSTSRSTLDTSAAVTTCPGRRFALFLLCDRGRVLTARATREATPAPAAVAVAADALVLGPGQRTADSGQRTADSGQRTAETVADLSASTSPAGGVSSARWITQAVDHLSRSPSTVRV